MPLCIQANAYVTKMFKFLANAVSICLVIIPFCLDFFQHVEHAMNLKLTSYEHPPTPFFGGDEIHHCECSDSLVSYGGSSLCTAGNGALGSLKVQFS